MSLTIGIIGAGGIAQVHAEAATKAGTRIAGFCDVIGERASSLSAKYPGSRATTSLDELLGWPDVSAVVVAVPNALHKPIAITAMRAGKHVLLEKPMALTVGECDEVLAVKRETAQIVQLGFVSRYAASVRSARAMIQSGRLGRIYHAKASMYRRRGIPGLGRWFTTRAQSGGGALIDLGVHMIDVVQHLAGSPKPLRVSGACTSTFGAPIDQYRFTSMWAGPPAPRGVFDVEDAATALVRYEGGLTFELNVVWAMNLPDATLKEGILLLGDRGGCYINIWGNELVLATEEDQQLVDVKPKLPEGEAWMAAWQREHEVFAQSVLEGREPEASPEAGRSVQALIDAIYRSSAAGREIDIA